MEPQAQNVGAFDLLADELVLAIASHLSDDMGDACRWSATCRRLRLILSDDDLWGPACVRDDPLLCGSTPRRWGRDWRWLYGAHAHVLSDKRATQRVPKDRTLRIVGRRTIALDGMISYVGEMDADHNPHGYGVLYYRGPFVPHESLTATAHSPLAESEQECESVAGPANTRWIDVTTRACLYAGHRTLLDSASAGASDGDNDNDDGDDDDDYDCPTQKWARGERMVLGDLIRVAVADSNTDRSSTNRISTGDRLEGLWRRDRLREGTVRVYDDDKKHYYEGEVRDSLYRGSGTSTHHNGEVYVGQWRDGRRNGRGTVRMTSGDTYECDWTDGAISTYGILRRPSGACYEGDVLKPEGYVKTTLASGTTIEGEWRNQDNEGFAVSRFPDGTRHEGQRSQGNCNGMGIFYDPFGFAYEGRWSDGRCIGEAALFYESTVYVRVFALEPRRLLARVVVDGLDDAVAKAERHPRFYAGRGPTADEVDEIALVPDDGRPWTDIDHKGLSFFTLPSAASLPFFFCTIVRAHNDEVASLRKGTGAV